MSFSIAQARRDAVRASWALRYLPVPPPDAWRTNAACRGLPAELFFEDAPGRGEPVSRQLAALCGSCPVRLYCLRDAAVAEEPHNDFVNGVRAGFSAAERRAMRRRAVRAVTAA